MNLINNSFGLGQANCNRFPETLLVGITRPNKFTGRLKMEQLVEQIKPINGFEGLYSISNYGYAISEAKKWITGTGRVCRKDKTILVNNINSRGYITIVLTNKGKHKTNMLHHLVWDHFGDQPRNGRILQVDHKDEDKLNTRIDNLQLLTQRENIAKYFKTRETTSRFTGVYWDKENKKCSANIQINGISKHLGYFTNEVDAANEYQRALKEFYDTGNVTIKTPFAKNKTSKHKGVCWHKQGKKWTAFIRINRKTIHLGSFENEYDAHLAYQKALKDIA